MNIGLESIVIEGSRADVSFPETADIRRHIRNILSGTEYPITEVVLAPQCIFDIGANVGATALFFRSIYPDAAIFCFEPSPSNFAFLEKNVQPFPNIRIFPFGLSNEDRQERLYLGRLHCLQHSIVRHPGLLDEYETVTLRNSLAVLQGLVGGGGILKVDAEGCEVPILLSLAPVLDNFDLIYVEYHSEADRLALDGILAPKFKLWRGVALVVHRGNLAYLSKRLLIAHPELEQAELRRA
jgi:FkbM family methyltransferase